MLKRVVTLGFFMFSIQAFAVGESVSYSIHQQYLSPRALGMGNAYVAVANDYAAIFYNPAGLAFRESGEMNFAFSGHASAGFTSFSKDISDASSTQGTETQKNAAMMAAIQKQYGNVFGVRIAPMEGAWVRPKWGIAFIPADVTLELSPANPLIINTTAYIDTTLAFSYADTIKSIETAKVSWGLTGKFINRGYFGKSVSAFELAADSNFVKTSDMKEGYFLDADLGFMYHPHIPDEGWYSVLRLARPTFGLAVRNLLDSGSMGTLKLLNKSATTSDKPEKLYRVIDIGSRWEYPEVFIFSGRGVLDIRDIMHPNFTVKKGLHLGFEFDWTMTSWWRGSYRFGMSQGYLTAGLSAMFSVFNLDLVTYSEDVGPSTGSTENRMYMMKANINF